MTKKEAIYNQLPAEVSKGIEALVSKKSDLEIAKWKSQECNLSTLNVYMPGYNAGLRDMATEYATKLHEAQEEIEKLESWKRQALEILNPLLDYADKQHLKLGSNKTEYILQRCKDHDEAIDLLTEALIQIEYLQKKFQSTGSGNNLISRIKNFFDGK